MDSFLDKIRGTSKITIAHVRRNREDYKLIAVAVLFVGGWIWALLSGRGIFLMLIATVAVALAALRIVRGPMDQSTDRSLPPMPQPSEVSDRVKRILSPTEVVHLESKEHPINLWKEVLAIVLAQGALVLFASQGAWGFGWIVWLAAMSWATWHLADWKYATRICVTNRRLIVTTGLLNRRYGEMSLSKMTDRSARFSIYSGALARLRLIDCEYGTVRVESAGQDQAIGRIVYIPDGFRFNRLVTHLTGGGS